VLFLSYLDARVSKSYCLKRVKSGKERLYLVTLQSSLIGLLVVGGDALLHGNLSGQLGFDWLVFLGCPPSRSHGGFDHFNIEPFSRHGIRLSFVTSLVSL
jgi:hypothetical protein